MVDFSYLRSPMGLGFGMGGGASPAGMNLGTFSPESMAGWGAPMPTAMPTTMPTTPGVPAGMPAMGAAKSGFGLNMDTANLALTGLSTIGNLWAAFNAQKMAREQFNFTKGVTETNLANQIKSYNTGIEDRGRNRAIVEGNSAEATKAYIDKNSLSRYGK